MKKILNKIGAVLQVVLAAPLKLPGKVGNILKYIAVGLGVLETVLKKEDDKPPPEGIDQPEVQADPSDRAMEERGDANETE